MGGTGHTGNDLVGLVHDDANLGIAVARHGAVVDVGGPNNGKRVIDDQVLGMHVNGVGRVDAASCAWVWCDEESRPADRHQTRTRTQLHT